MSSLTSRGWTLAAEARAKVLANPRVRHAIEVASRGRYYSGLDPHDRMLADDVRVDTYHEALTKLIEPGDVVVDIGAGTGILSYWAAKAGAEKVYALDYSTLLETADELVRANGVSNVEFVPTHSRDFAPELKVDKIIHEQMGVQLFNEDMMENLVDVRDRLLRPGGRIVPNLFELFIDPVQLDDEYWLPFVWERTIHGFDPGLLRNRKDTEAPGYFLHRFRPNDFSHFLSASEPVLTVDVETVASPELPQRLSWRREVTRDGRLDGFGMWFIARFDDEIELSTSPEARNTHWGFTLLRVEAEEIRAGQTVEFELNGRLEDTDTWTWSHKVLPA